MLQRPDEIASERDLKTRELVRRFEVYIRSGNIEGPGDFEAVEIRLQTIGIAHLLTGFAEFMPFVIEIVRDKLVVPGILSDDPRLPCEVFRRKFPAVFLKCPDVARVNRRGRIRKRAERRG